MPYYLIADNRIVGDVGESIEGLEIAENTKILHHDLIDYRSIYYDQVADAIKLKPPDPGVGFYWDESINKWQQSPESIKQSVRPSPNWVGFRQDLFASSAVAAKIRGTKASNEWALFLIILTSLQDEILFSSSLIECLKGVRTSFNINNLRTVNSLLSTHYFNFQVTPEQIGLT